jgi:tRNA(Arg) A34 adenosine deaminase TadA
MASAQHSVPEEDPDVAWMRAAIDEGNKALDCCEVPVGCVFVKDSVIVGRGHNRTNMELDATRHAGTRSHHDYVDLSASLPATID